MANVVMPQMGESIAEGTIVRWIKKVGDSVDRDEPLFEISTDKVDAEIPSPSAGVLTEIMVKEGETVPVNSVVAVIGAAGEKPAAASGAGGGAEAGAGGSAMPAAAVGQKETSAPSKGTPVDDRSAVAEARPSDAAARAAAPGRSALERGAAAPEVLAARPPDRQGTRRRHPADPGHRHQRPRHQARHPRLHRIGRSDRAHQRPRRRPAPQRARVPDTGPGLQARRERADRADERDAQEDRRAHGDERAHLAARLLGVRGELRQGHRSCATSTKGAYEAAGAKLTFTGFIAKAIVDALRQFPMVNASIDGENIVYKKDINLGIAVALDNGLIVPVIRNADEKNLLGLSRAHQRPCRPRAVEEAQSRRSAGRHLHDHQPGHLRRALRPAADQPAAGRDPRRRHDREARRRHRRCDRDSTRPATSRLGYDHRLIDGADAGRFLALHLKERIEKFDEAWM